MSTLYRTQSPATGELIKSFENATDEEIQEVLRRADESFIEWASLSMAERGWHLNQIADLLEERTDELASAASLEMGKSVPEAVGELEVCVQIFRYYAAEGEALAADQELKNFDGGTAILRRRPVGPLLGIMPWNFPYYQVARFVAPNLMLGNTIILKHAEICASSAILQAELFADAGIPLGVYNNVFATHRQVSTIIEDPRVQGVSLTGSERAGAAVAEQAGRALKKVVLELGGSDPYIILGSNDVVATAREALAARMFNSGQACTSNKRIIVMNHIYDDFVEAIVKAARELTPGDPVNPQVGTYSPLSSSEAVDLLLEQIADARSNGATIHTGGNRANTSGFYLEPTVITGITPKARAYREELFGPVAMVYRVNTYEEAVELANDSDYGLGGSVISPDTDKARALGEKLNVGMVHINGFNRGGAQLPFGGIKRSGYGRELGPLGMDEFVNKQLLTVTE